MNWRHVLQQTLYREVRVTAPSPHTPLSAMPQDTARTLPAPYSPWANQLMPPEQHFGDHPPHFPSMPMFWVQEQRRAHDGSPQQNNSHCAKIGLKMTLNPTLGVRLLVSRPHHPPYKGIQVPRGIYNSNSGLCPQNWLGSSHLGPVIAGSIGKYISVVIEAASRYGLI